MLEFRTLGTIELRGEDGTPIHEPLRHTKRTALLAYLATPNPIRLHRRETLVALLWPDLDEHHGRGILRHELYELRRSLGPDILCSDGRELAGVNGDRLWCDARAFGDQLADGHLMEALDLVRGEFLPGLHVDGGEFDRWLDGERGSMARRAAKAAERLSMQASTKGDLAGAVRWARRWTDMAPYDETAWSRLVSLLDQSGDRAGALSAYAEFVSRLRDDLEIEPAPETRELVEGIRTRTSIAANSAPVPQPPVPVVIAIRPVENLTGDARHDLLARRLADRLAGAIAAFR